MDGQKMKTQGPGHTLDMDTYFIHIKDSGQVVKHINTILI